MGHEGLETDLDFKIVFRGANMAELFEMENFDSYKEDNRREVKKQKADFQTAYGKPILPLPTVMAELSFLA